MTRSVIKNIQLKLVTISMAGLMICLNDWQIVFNLPRREVNSRLVFGSVMLWSLNVLILKVFNSVPKKLYPKHEK